jgi:hypothetical protein
LTGKDHDQKLHFDSEGATKIGSSIGGGHETGEASVWFSLLIALMQFKVILVNAITTNVMFNVNKV